MPSKAAERPLVRPCARHLTPSSAADRLPKTHRRSNSTASSACTWQARPAHRDEIPAHHRLAVAPRDLSEAVCVAADNQETWHHTMQREEGERVSQPTNAKPLFPSPQPPSQEQTQTDWAADCGRGEHSSYYPRIGAWIRAVVHRCLARTRVPADSACSSHATASRLQHPEPDMSAVRVEHLR